MLNDVGIPGEVARLPCVTEKRREGEEDEEEGVEGPGTREGEKVEMEKRFQGPEKVEEDRLELEEGVEDWRWNCRGAKERGVLKRWQM
jgi:hypothetical protein